MRRIRIYFLSLLVSIFCVIHNAQAQIELITNGNFAATNAGWQSDADFYYNKRFSCFNKTSGYAYLADADGKPKNNAGGVLGQNVTIPSNATSAILTFYYNISTEETTTTKEYDLLQIYFCWNGCNSSKDVGLLTNLNKTGSNTASCNTYKKFTYTLPSILFGKSLTLYFQGSTDGGKPTVFRIDDVSLMVTSCGEPNAPSSSTTTINSTSPFGNDHQIDQTWSSVADADGYEVSRSTDNQNWRSSLDKGSDTKHTWSLGENPNRAYYFRVRSYKTCGGSKYYSDWKISSPSPFYTACNPPAPLLVGNVTNNSIDLAIDSESPEPNPEITTYAIYCTTYGKWVQADGALANGAVYRKRSDWGIVTVKDLVEGDNYCFYAVAKNELSDVRYDQATAICVTAESCVEWTNGQPSKPDVLEAAEFLCKKGIISSLQDYTALNSKFDLKEACLIVSNSLKGLSRNIPSDLYPTPFFEVNKLSSDYRKAVKAMLYLDYNDGTPPLSRNYYFFALRDEPQLKQLIRLVLEAWNISPDIEGYDPTSTDYSSFSCDIKRCDPYYGWVKEAFKEGWLDGLEANCNECSAGECLQGSYNEWEFLYVLLYNVMSSRLQPTITADSFFIPNNFSPESIGAETDVSRAVFTHYEQPSISIPSAGPTLEFSHSYHSNFSELPVLSEENFTGEGLQATLQRMHPLGIGWTHNYNIYITRAFRNNTDRKLFVHWPDGTVNIYDLATNKYETQGVYDQLVIHSKDVEGNADSITITRKDQIKYCFNRDGMLLKLVRILDRNDNQLLLTYEARACTYNNIPCWGVSQRLKEVQDLGSNRTITFSYQEPVPLTGNDLISTVSDGTRTLRFFVDPLTLNLTSFVNAKSNATVYEYCNQPNCSNLLTSIVRPKGNTITNLYVKRKLKQSKNNNYTIDVEFKTEYESGEAKTSTAVSVKKGGETLKTDYTHEKNGNIASISSPSKRLSIKYGDLVNPTLPTRIIDSSTQITEEFVYDSQGNTQTHTQSASEISRSEKWEYNLFNNVTQYTDAMGGTARYEYDSKGNLLKLTDPLGNATTFTINTQGLVTSVQNPAGLQTQFEYNSYGNLNAITKQADNSTIIVKAEYDELSRVTSVTAPNGSKTLYTYDVNDNVIEQNEDAGGLNYLTKYDFDANNNPIEIQNARGYNTILQYDFHTDDLIKEKFGAYAKEWTYNTDGSLKTFKNKNGAVFNYEYFPEGDTREGLLKSDGYAQYDYNTETKQLTSVAQGSNLLTYIYDKFLRITGIDYNDFAGNSVQYSYDLNDNIKQIIYPGGKTISYEYDLNTRLTKVSDWKDRVLVTYTYLNDGRIATETYGNGATVFYYYNIAGRLDSLVHKARSDTILGYYVTKWDGQGNIVRETKYEPFHPTVPNYTYLSHSYAYDTLNRLTNIDTIVIEYDANGNQIKFGNSNFSYNAHDKLTSAGNLSFEYDPINNRRRKNDVRYTLDILDNASILSETNLGGEYSALYVYGLGLVCRYDPVTDSYHYYHCDSRGSVVGLSHPSGDSLSHFYRYGPFGETVGVKEKFPQPFRYIGKHGVVYDSDSLHFMRARYYNPQLGRFLSEDPVWSTNLYPYGDNNPIKNIDPKGEYVETALDIASFVYDLNEFRKRPSVENGLYLLADVITTALPGAAGGGTILRLTTKRANKVVTKIHGNVGSPFFSAGVS